MQIANMTSDELKAAFKAKQAQEQGANRVFNTIMDACHLKNDAALAKHLRVGPAVISKMRSGVSQLSASMIIRIHEYSSIPVSQIKALAGQSRFDGKK